MTNDQIQKLIEAVEEAYSADGLFRAVKALAETKDPAGIPTLIKVLGYNNPGAAVAAVDGLIAMGEPAAEQILECLDGYNYGARSWAVRALAGIGDPRGLELLLVAAESDFALSVRRAAARGLGNLRWEKLPAPARAEAQTQTHSTLALVCQDPEWVVRYAGVVGLEGLAAAVKSDQPVWFNDLKMQLEKIALTDSVMAVRARALWAMKNCGF
ncbi:HEAT repeat domain-containing protein [Ancylothrix sp. C2]|uniref:HEAT repeat domain-containing protein n=1 Tax=Ancylothrix sp. D3o TaxID=2953691 RepID=UPI0021BA694D|nr:HEAT repeat domain-containing protein [Ancylothrix sp. D3o]MCT7948761.1 HEAT repeat domain-containing protein [Ancylothrix sp. D3o]